MKKAGLLKKAADKLKSLKQDIYNLKSALKKRQHQWRNIFFAPFHPGTCSKDCQVFKDLKKDRLYIQKTF